VCWSHCLQAACLSGQLDTWLHCDAGCRQAIQTTRHWSVSLLILCTLIIVLEANLGLKVPPDQIFMTLALALGTIAVASKAQILVGLESWEFFVSRYRVKLSDDIVILSWNFCGPFAGSAHPVCRLDLARKLATSVSPFLLHGGCSLAMAHHSWSAQCQVIWPNTLYTRYHCQCTSISSCCEVHDDIIGHNHTIRALDLGLALALRVALAIFSQPSIYIDGWLYGMRMTTVTLRCL